jgi:TBC1 domain family member 15
LKYFDEVLKYINELSTTIDLSSTRVRAEGLFYKFQRVVESADRKNGFAAPGEGSANLRNRRSESSGGGEGGMTSGAAVNKGKAVESGGEGPVISEELRMLLKKDIIKAK